ncbi:hypothetical protein RO3G_07195 [Rhizopus delemar RA 99-880]|uniref:Uncharacterized protein n=1 Tax=Rhizopus delemar (strain RA 99-880 / ATCC MYA-4621 / FGSC 9543 / NRRL 43880) TaxID=246409 RepID=I1C210_RHIO9|nr:hypothetical protein RO3G_07195 [Rhizopus delemar RA 99-880]|eukprot:EIE82490.1 hypothetical protein RO3G_07195 [Rhizopus delemar RA 99-880]
MNVVTKLIIPLCSATGFCKHGTKAHNGFILMFVLLQEKQGQSRDLHVLSIQDFSDKDLAKNYIFLNRLRSISILLSIITF